MSTDSSDRERNLAALAAALGTKMPKPATGLKVNSAPPPPPQFGLLSVFSRPEARGLYYNGKRIRLDGYRFVSCRFDNCVLEVASTNFDLIHCVLDDSTTIVYLNETAKIIRLFNSRSTWASDATQKFAPIRNSDGSITITDAPA